MADYKVTWRFIGINGEEWTEQFYVGGAGSPTSAAHPSQELLAARLNLLHPFNTLRSVTAADVAGNRNTAPNVVNLAGTEGTDSGGAVPFGPEVAEGACVIAYVGVNGSKRKQWLRGFTRGAAFRSGQTGRGQISPQFRVNLEAYIAALAINGYGIRKLTPIANPALQIVPITSLDPVTFPGFSVLTIGPGLALVNGATVIIQKTSDKDTPALKGKWTVFVVDATHVRIPYIPPNRVVLPAAIGTMKVAAYNPVDIISPANSGFDHYGSHDTKVPASHSRGARRAKRIRQLP